MYQQHAHYLQGCREKNRKLKRDVTITDTCKITCVPCVVGAPSKPKGVGREEAREKYFPPPIWQVEKPREKAVVTKDDLKGFEHFWLANEEHKLLMVAIPKVCVYSGR